MKLTDAQAAAVTHRGSNLLVSASAGSGKTQVLAERCLHLLSDEEAGCDVTQLLVLTFTRAAASELRARIGRRLREAARIAERPDARARLMRQALRIDLAEIGTIDAWCQRQVREHFAACGADPAFRLLSEEDALLLRREALDELFEWVGAADDPAAREARRWLRRSGQATDDWLRGAVRALSTFREHLVNPQAWFARQRALLGAPSPAEAPPAVPNGTPSESRDSIRALARATVAAALRSEFELQLEQLPALADRLSHPDIIRGFQEYADNLRTWSEALARPDSLEGVIAAMSAWKLPGYNYRKQAASVLEKQLRDQLKDRWLRRRLTNVWSPDVLAAAIDRADEAAQHLGVLLDLEQRYDALLAMRKRGLGAYEFADVQRMALDLLGEPPSSPQAAEQPRTPSPTALRLRERYRHVLIDEYQDTSPVQVELLRLVSRETPQTSNRFMVGDVKQSIYGFRQAEPRLFSALADRFRSGGGDGRLLHLSDNFRTHQALLEALNEMFAMLLEPRLGGTPFGPDERLRACRADLPNATLDGAPRVSVHVLQRAKPDPDEPRKDEKPPEQIELEARVAAREIRTLMQNRVQVVERRGAEGPCLRPARYGDIVILLRSARYDAARVAAVLRDEGIPCVAAGRESVFDSREVQDLRNVLSLLGNRRQDVPLAGYLRGPLVGLSDADLLAIRRRRPRGPYHRAVLSYLRRGEDEALRAKVEQALGRLAAWREFARQEELPAVLRRILRDTQLDLVAHAMPGGAQRAAMLHALDALARRFMAGGGGGPADFAEWLDALSEEDLTPSVTALEAQDAVPIITIHAAKGLEYPFVFLLGTGARLAHRTEADSLPCDVSGGVGLRCFNFFDGRLVCNAAHPIVSEEQRRRNLEEELRLLYVAATRAKERLYVVGTSRSDPWASALDRFPAGRRPMLIERIDVSSVLEWVLMSVAAAALHLRADGERGAVRVCPEAPSPPPQRTPREPATPGAPQRGETHELTDADRSWVDQAERLISAVPATDLAERPAALSVSAFKALAQRDEDDDDPSALLPSALDHLGPALRDPDFARAASADEADGRAAGTALHRFMQHADLARLRTPQEVRAQLDAFVSAKLLRAGDAALVPVEDVCWFAATDQGCRLAAAPRCRREAPFVYGLPIGLDPERIVLRGVIDCMVEEPDGLHLIDYKTDNPADDRDFAARVEQYSIQLLLYAQAVAAIYNRPVRSALLVFLRMRRLVEVALDGPMIPAARRALDALRAAAEAR